MPRLEARSQGRQPVYATPDASPSTSSAIHISPATPRAIYFNDAVYVEWVQGGPAIEISAVDPKLGAVFYTVDHEPGMGAKLERKMGVCLQC